MDEKTYGEFQAEERTSLEPLLNKLVEITERTSEISDKKSPEHDGLKGEVLAAFREFEQKGVEAESLFWSHSRGEFLDGTGNVYTLIGLPNEYVIEGYGSSGNWQFDTVEILSAEETPKRIAELARMERKLFQKSGS